jgi:hypothetical protein
VYRYEHKQIGAVTKTVVACRDPVHDIVRHVVEKNCPVCDAAQQVKAQISPFRKDGDNLHHLPRAGLGPTGKVNNDDNLLCKFVSRRHRNQHLANMPDQPSLLIQAEVKRLCWPTLAYSGKSIER